jgi:glucose/arabinose dehydrogenase
MSTMRILMCLSLLFGSFLAQSTCAESRLNLIELPDGALLVSDDAADLIYRISYQ